MNINKNPNILFLHQEILAVGSKYLNFFRHNSITTKKHLHSTIQEKNIVWEDNLKILHYIIGRFFFICKFSLYGNDENVNLV